MSNMIARQAAWNLNATNAILGQSVLRLSSGLRINKPSDGMWEYIRGSSLESDVRLYQGVKSSLSEYKSVFTLANDAASEIRKKLESMLEKATAASNPGMSSTERDATFVEYNSMRTGIDNIVKGTKYQGGGILDAAGQYNQPLNITITPDRSVTMSVDLDALDVSNGGPGGIIVSNAAWTNETDASASATELQTALDTVDTFMSKASSAINELDSHVRITDNKIQNYSAARSSLIDTNVADEMATYTALDVTKQAATAMLAQANLSQRSILQLYEFNYS